MDRVQCLGRSIIYRNKRSDQGIRPHMKGRTVSGHALPGFKEPLGRIGIPGKIGQHIQSPETILGPIFLQLYSHLIAPPAVFPAKGLFIHIKLTHSVCNNMLVAFSGIVKRITVKIIIPSKHGSCVDLRAIMGRLFSWI